MQENYELVQKGFRILHPLMAAYIGKEMNRVYHNGWWQQALMTLSDQSKDLPDNGDYAELIDSLDIANCIRLTENGEMYSALNFLSIIEHGPRS